MAEEAAVIATPVVEAAPVAPVTTPTVEAPVTTTTPVAAPVAETTSTTVLGDSVAPQPVPVETPVAESTTPVAEAPKDAQAQSDEPAPAPVFEPFKLPDDTKLNEERVKEFTGILSELETKAKADHKLVQEFGQKAVDFHLKEIKAAQDNLVSLYVKEWENQKVKWKDEFLADPDIGGKRQQTTIDSALSFIRTHGGTDDQQTELRNLFNSSGLGNHKAVIRLLANAGRAMSEGKPLQAPAAVPQTRSKIDTLYGPKSSN